jgi:hypothetical protein
MAEPSGAPWCSRFPGSRSTDDLTEPFRTSAKAFLAALAAANPPAAVSIAATLRPPQRAYLMHWAWAIAHGSTEPEDVPAMSGVDIVWDHPGAVAAAQAMVAGYGMVFTAALNSDHTRGEAIDMNITWSDSLSLRDKNGVTHTISSGPRDNRNTELQAVAMTFGVHKLATDPPHWSIDGK